jgi:hypothetical protein
MPRKKSIPPDRTQVYNLTPKDEKRIMKRFEQGASRAQVKNEIRKIRGTFSNDLWDRWLKDEPEFVKLIEQGLIASQDWWENAGQTYLVTDKETTFNNSAFIFQMKNRFKEDYGDVQKVDLTSKGEKVDSLSVPPVVNLNVVSSKDELESE